MDIKTQQKGRVAYLTLDKPDSLNALTESMIDELAIGLARFEADDSVGVIVINSTSTRAFCAGGNMKRIRELALANDVTAIDAFFTKEYALNLAIAECGKPYIAVIDGVAMGGGLGLSVHGSHRIVTERAVMAMPETRIGFFPDVGGSYFLPKLTRNAGRWMSMTAAPVRGHEAVSVGLGTHFVRSSNLDSMLAKLESADTGSINDVIANSANEFENQNFSETLESRSHWFSPHSLGEIRSTLQQVAPENEDAAHLLKLLDEASPYSLAVTMKLFSDTEGLSLKACLAHEKTASMEAAFHADFIEGVRAVLIDKDHMPNWSVSTVR